jgi:hypothetical protein
MSKQRLEVGNSWPSEPSSIALELSQLLTIGALFQYGVTRAIFLKIAVFWNGLPPHSVKLNREKTE